MVLPLYSCDLDRVTISSTLVSSIVGIDLDQQLSICDTWASSMSITWEPVVNVNSWAPYETYGIRTLGRWPRYLYICDLTSPLGDSDS